jgi:hypothetical protein
VGRSAEEIFGRKKRIKRRISVFHTGKRVLALMALLFAFNVGDSVANEGYYNRTEYALEGSLGVKGCSIGFGGRKGKSVLIMGHLTFDYDLLKEEGDKSEAGTDWNWLVPVEQYEETYGGFGGSLGIHFPANIPMQIELGTGLYFAAPVVHYVSSVTGWDWYKTGSTQTKVWYLVGVRYEFAWSPQINGYLSLSHDPVQFLSLGFGIFL